MMRNADQDSPYTWELDVIRDDFCWTGGGKWLSGETRPFDLVAEVHVSDTPQVNTTKTARDELVEKAALAILNGRYANPSPMSSYKFAEIWLAAEHFVEARKK